MIGKITMGSSFKGCISYCLEDKKLEHSQEPTFKNRAELILYNQCFGNKKELTEQFNDVRALNQKVQKPVLHITLSLSPEDQLDKPKLIEMASQCAKEMGFEKNQFIAISHVDTGHQHLHIVANRIGYDGKAVSDSQNYKKIAAFCRAMELKYDLKQVLSPRKYLKADQRDIPRLDTRKEKLKTNIKECLSASKTFSEFESNMKQKGYEIIKGRGISFTDEKKVKFKGSEVGYPLQKIERTLTLQQQLLQVNEDRIKNEQSIKPGQGHKITYDLYKQYRQKRDDLAKKNDYLSTTIEILLRPETNETNLPAELMNAAKKKKRRKHQHL